MSGQPGMDIMGALMGLNPFDRARDQLARIENFASPAEKEAVLIAMSALASVVDLRKTKAARLIAARRAENAFSHWTGVVLDPDEWTEPAEGSQS
jgi:hypothetical protein